MPTKKPQQKISKARPQKKNEESLPNEVEAKVAKLTQPIPRKVVVRRRPFSQAVYVITWLTGIIVSLAVGFGMISGTLTIPYFQFLVPIAGIIVVILTLANLLLGIINALTKI